MTYKEFIDEFSSEEDFRVEDTTEPIIVYVTTRGEPKNWIIRSKSEGRAYLRKLKELTESHNAWILGYSLYTDETHIVLGVRTLADLFEIQHELDSYFIAQNVEKGRSASPFSDPPRYKHIPDADALIKTVKKFVNNDV